MTMLDDTTALVFSTDDIREAVESDNGVELVYFGADITLAYGITIYPSKPSLTFDGTYEGVTYTFTDMSGTSSTNTLGVRSVSNITITFQNINLIGRNYYGIPYVPNISTYNNISTIYHNVTYSGVQLSHNPFGFTRYTDCNITVNYQEAGEVSRLEIGGVTTITKTNQANAVFWFYGSSARPSYMKILTGARVTIATANYFMYEHYPPAYIIEPGASLTLNTNSGISLDGAHTAASFLVDENASFIYTQASTGGAAAIFLDGALTVNEGAVFYMQADFFNTGRLIRFTGSSCGLYINNPKSFALYNKGNSSATAFYFASEIPVTLSGGQLNYWEDATDFPEAGTFEDIPLHKWNRPSWNRFTLRGTASNSRTNITFNDFTPEELALLDPLSDLQLDDARVLSVGEIPLTIYSTVITRQITGATEPYANIKVIFMPSYFVDPNTTVAGVDGLFAMTPSAPMPFSDYVEVLSNTPFLIVSETKAVHEADELYIYDAPESIGFPARPMPDFPGIILPRDDLDCEVVVMDTRQPKTEWQLWVRISSPLETEDGDVLDDAVVFVVQSGAMETVGSSYIAIHTDGPYARDDTSVTWEETKGLLVRITVPIRSGKRYSTRLEWTVTPAGEQPEEE